MMGYKDIGICDADARQTVRVKGSPHEQYWSNCASDAAAAKGHVRTGNASRDHGTRQVEDLLHTLVAEGLEAHTTIRELLEHVSEDYRARLTREGKLDQSSDDVLQELRDLREQITRELYPG